MTCLTTLSDVDSTGAFRIDRSPKHFAPLLGYLRHGTIHLDEGVSARGPSDSAAHAGGAARGCLPASAPGDAHCSRAHVLFATGVLAEAHFFGLWGAVEELEPLARAEALKLMVRSCQNVAGLGLGVGAALRGRRAKGASCSDLPTDPSRKTRRCAAQTLSRC